ncbi:MAG: PD-(D/E)XK nuclease family protein [Pirellulales bacterium]|nr:PD-(D/E)XK nuclease family protein [Alphaproteobacteria bacterium]MDA8030483.1 PD-(D/E)XK nuclease family protein [Alphaproteobacteria bacterium]MDA8041386.1 PD-(D/E)XK nuclease family protein [Pirellulales bacterium]
MKLPTTDAPNIFAFATSERSQDAVLAYMLKWASRDHKDANPDMHKLGKKFLRALLECTQYGATSGMHFTKVSVETQKKTTKPGEGKTRAGRVDVQVEVNDEICLVIEDKTHTNRHEGQIKNYAEDADTDCPDVRPIYLKTGNESLRTLKKTQEVCEDHNGGTFYRKNLLAVLPKHTGNRFIDDFRQHLDEWEKATIRFEAKKVDDWDWRAHQGYYLRLEELLRLKRDEGWGKVDNASGGFQGFWGYFVADNRNKCDLYFQIHDSKDLYIRCAAWKENNDGQVSPKLRVRMFQQIQDSLSRLRNTKIRVKGPMGRVGKSTNIAQVFFDAKKQETDTTYMVLNKAGKADVKATAQRLRDVAKLIDMSCK